MSPRTTEFEFALREALAESSLELTETQIAGLAAHCAAVTHANESLNLTRIVEPREVARKHVLDSLAGLAWPGLRNARKVLDAGSGAGWPGLALAIALPSVEMVLLEATRKKVLFLEKTIAALELDGRVRTVWGRLEDREHKPLVMGHGYVTARAVSSIDNLVRWYPPEASGRLLLWKGPRAEAELDQASQTLERVGRYVESCWAYRVPDDPTERRLLVVAPTTPRPQESAPRKRRRTKPHRP